MAVKIGNNDYQKWLNGNDCCCANNFITISGNCNHHQDVCDCDNILLEISNLHTDDGILQEEIDDLSGQVETKLDASAYTPTDLSDYYTKEEVDALIPEVPSLSGYATEQWVEDKNYLTEHQPLKTINGQVISGTGNIEIEASGTSITVDSELSLISTNPVENKVITEALNAKLDASAYTPTDLSEYVTNSTLIQYVTNLQEQINSLISQISGCCGSSGETLYRWITETGENDYWCSGTTKYSMEKEQSSTDGINWTDTGSERSGSTVLEENCVECGYVPPLTGKKYSGVTTANTEGSYDCNCIEGVNDSACKELIAHELTFVFNPRGVGKMKSVTVGECVNVIGNGCFGGESNLETLILPSTITAIKGSLFEGCTSIESLTLLGTTPPIFYPMTSGAYAGLFGYGETPPVNFKIYVPTSAVNTYKAATGWSDYASIIQGI